MMNVVNSQRRRRLAAGVCAIIAAAFA